jgi:hypothetical protein
MSLLLPALAALALVSSAEPADDQPVPEKSGETRQSLSVSDEGSLAAALRIPGSDLRNLLLIQPSFAYKWKGRFRFSSSLAAFAKTQDETHAQLRWRETYVGFSAGELDLAVGKRLQRWGTGYAFTATGILDPPRVAADPTDRLSLNEGREMIQADWIHGKHDFSFVWASAGLLERHRPGMRETAAFRYNVLIGGLDTSAIVAYDRGGPAFVGGNFTRVLGQAIEVHSELAWREGLAVLLGGKYTHGSGVAIVAELYTPPNTAYYRPAGMPASAGRQHYGFLRTSKSRLRELPGWKEWDVAVSLVANLDDGSRIAVLDAGRRFGNHLYAYTHAEAPDGKRSSSQYGKIPYSALISVGVRLQM